MFAVCILYVLYVCSILAQLFNTFYFPLCYITQNYYYYVSFKLGVHLVFLPQVDPPHYPDVLPRLHSIGLRAVLIVVLIPRAEPRIRYADIRNKTLFTSLEEMKVCMILIRTALG